MSHLQTLIKHYLEYCTIQKCLDVKTLKAYCIDLRQFSENNLILTKNINEITTSTLENYISFLHKKYKPKTVKRKIASMKSFFYFLEYRNIITKNPFMHLKTYFREPQKLPKTIPLHTLELFLSTIYKQYNNPKTSYQKENALRDIAVIELLFSSGMRISELCSLHPNDINLHTGVILIHGKRNKERLIQLGNKSVINLLNNYYPELFTTSSC